VLESATLGFFQNVLLDNNLDNIVECIKVEGTGMSINALGEGNRSNVGGGDFISIGILHDISMKIGSRDDTKVLLVVLFIGSIYIRPLIYRPLEFNATRLTLIAHERHTALNLSIQDGKPQLLGRDGLSSLTSLLVAKIKFLKFLTIGGVKTRAFVGTHQRPISILLNA